MCAKERLSAKAEIVQVKPPGQERFYRDDSCRETPGYRARNPGGSPLSRIVLGNLPEFEQWLKNPTDSRPRPHPAVITALEKFVECGVMRYGVVRYRCPGCGSDILVALGYLAYCTSSGRAVIG